MDPYVPWETLLYSYQYCAPYTAFPPFLLSYSRPNTVFEKRETSKANRPSPLLGRATLNLRKRLEVADQFLGSPRKGEKGCSFLRNLVAGEKNLLKVVLQFYSLSPTFACEAGRRLVGHHDLVVAADERWRRGSEGIDGVGDVS